MWRRSFIVLAVLCGVLAGVVIALKSRRVSDNLKAYLARMANEQLGVTLTIEELEVELVPPGVALAKVEVRRPNLADPWITLHRGRVLIRPWPSAAGALVIHHLELDGLEGAIDLRGKESLFASDDDSRMSIDVREMLVWNADVSLQTDDLSLELQRTDFQLTPHLGGRTLEITIGHAVVTRDGTPIPFELAARAQLEGSVNRPESLTVERAFLALKQVTLSASGGVSLANGPEFDLAVEARAPLQALTSLLPDSPEVSGLAECELKVTGSPLSPHSRVHLLLTDLELEETDLGQVELHAVHEGERVNIESFRVSHRSAGSVTGSGTVDLTERLPLTITARTHRASLPHILDLAGLPDTWVPLALNADIRGTGSLSPFRLQLNMGGTVNGFAVHDRSYREPDPFKVLDIPDIGIEGDFSINPWAVTIQELRISPSDRSVLAVSGALKFDQSMDLRASGEQVHMPDIGAIAGITYDGHGALAATLEGPFEDLVISGTVEMDDFGVHDFFLGDTKATIIFTAADAKLAIDRAVVRRGGGAIKASGAFLLGATIPGVVANAELDDVDIAHILHTIGATALAERIHADVDGTVHLDGKLAMPTGTIALASPKLRVDGVPLGKLTIAGGFDDGEELIWGDVRVEPEKGELKARAAARADGTMTLSADATSIPLALLQPFIGNAAIGGRLTGKTRLHGPPNQLSGEIDANVSRLTVADLKLETTRLHANIELGSMTVTGSALTGAARVDANIELGRHLPYTATATFQKLELGRLTTLPTDLGVTMTGTLFSQGDMTRTETVMADVHLDSTDIAWTDLKLTAVRPVRLQYANGTVQVDDLILSGSGAQLSAAGTISGDGLNMQVNGNGDLRPTGGSSSELEWLRGKFEVVGRIQGQLASPKLSGKASLHDGALKVPGTGTVLDEIETELKFSGRTITVASSTAKFGGGDVRIGGRILLPLEGESNLNLRADLDGVTFRPQPQLFATATGNLNLVGPLDDLLLHGRLEIDSLRYTANLVLDRLIPRRNAPPLKVPAIDPDKAIRLAVGLHAPGNVIIQNNVVDTELRVDLTVTGTSERIGLIGSIAPLRANARYRDNVFEVERATIDFSEEFRIYTQFDLRATTEACDMAIAVNVHGNSDVYNVDAQGEDENGVVNRDDVFTCLLSGLRAQELRAQLAPTDTATDDSSNPLDNPVFRSSLDLAWTVSGMDEKVRKLLPIELNEVRLESGWSNYHRKTTTRVLVGKDISNRLQLRYSRSIDEIDDQTLSFEYQLSDIAALEGNWLSASNVSVGDFGLDLRLRWEFR